MINILQIYTNVVLCFLFLFNINAKYLMEGKQYIKLSNQINNVPKLLEFFSFYCPHCYQFEEIYHISSKINKYLPKDTKIVRYHVDFLGKFGKQLTHAWALAMVLGIEEQINQLIFDAIQNKQLIHSGEDIKAIFLKSGISSEKYDKTWNSDVVNELITQQRKAASNLKLRGVPAIFINGRYMVKSNTLDSSTIDAYIKEFINVIQLLIVQ